MADIQQNNVPALRFSEFQGEWINRVLSDACSSISSGRTKPDESGEFPVYGSRDIIGYSLDYTHQGEKLLVARVGAHAGSINLVKGRYSVTDNTLIIENKSNLNTVFFYNRLLNYNLNRLVFGSGQPLITGGQIKKLKLFIPQLTEQQKIAEFLTCVDEKIEALANKKELLEKYKKSVMKKLFSQQIRFTNDNGKAYSNWEEKKLSEISKKVTQKNKNNSTSMVLTNSAVHGIISQRDFFDKDIANKNNLDGYYVVQKDDFVYNPRISKAAPVGPLKRNNLSTGVMSPLYTVFSFVAGNLEYLEYYFQTTFWHEYMKTVANYGARYDRMNITGKDFNLLPIPFPHPDEQQKIANFLTAIDDKIDLVTNQLNQTKAFKKGLLQQMFV